MIRWSVRRCERTLTIDLISVQFIFRTEQCQMAQRYFGHERMMHLILIPDVHIDAQFIGDGVANVTIPIETQRFVDIQRPRVPHQAILNLRIMRRHSVVKQQLKYGLTFAERCLQPNRRRFIFLRMQYSVGAIVRRKQFKCVLLTRLPITTQRLVREILEICPTGKCGEL